MTIHAPRPPSKLTPKNVALLDSIEQGWAAADARERGENLRTAVEIVVSLLLTVGVIFAFVEIFS